MFSTLSTLSQTSCLPYNSFENIVGKGEIAPIEKFLLFPQCFLSFRRTFCHFYQLQNCRLQALSDWESQKFVVWERVIVQVSSKAHIGLMIVCMSFSVNPFPNKPWFLCVCSTSLLKTQREKEKLLVTSNFSFSHSVFYLFGEFFAIFIQVKIVICKAFEFNPFPNKPWFLHVCSISL